MSSSRLIPHSAPLKALHALNGSAYAYLKTSSAPEPVLLIDYEQCRTEITAITPVISAQFISLPPFLISRDGAFEVLSA